MKRSILHSLRIRLLLIVLITVVPGILLTIHMGNEGRRYAKIAAFEEAKRLALLTAGNCKSLFDGARHLLLAIAQMPEVRQSSKTFCHKFLVDLLKQYPGYENFFVVQPDGQIFCTALASDRRINVADRPWFQRVTERKNFTIGESVVGRISRKPIMNLAYPVLGENDKIQSIVAISLNLEWLNTVATSMKFPEGATVSIIDRSGAFLTRFPADGDWFLKSIPKAGNIMVNLIDRGVDTAEEVGIDGVPRLYAFAPLVAETGNELFVRIGIPTSVAYAEADQLRKQNVTLLLAVACFALLGTYFFGNVFILRPTADLVQATKRLAAGDLSFRTGVTHQKGELAWLARSFDHMADALENYTTKLKEAEEKYRGLFESAPVGIFRSTPQGRYLSANTTMARMYGYDSPEDLIENVTSIGDQIYINPNERSNLLILFDKNDEVKNFEAQVRRKDGAILWTSRNLRAVRDSSGTILYFDGFAIDTTERKKLERDLTKAKEAAVNATLAKSAFLSMASHELRTPLTSILGFVKLIAKNFQRHLLPLLQSGDSSKTKAHVVAQVVLENLEIISHEGERLGRLVNDLLDLNKIESGDVMWHALYVDMTQLIREAANSIGGQVKARPGLALLVDVPDDLPQICVDPDRIKQVLMNLLNNAAKFTAKGSIRVTARTIPGPGIEVRVEDTGPGVPADHRERIFEAFHQVPGHIDGNTPKGTGLGLAICRQIIEHYKGAIWVESEEGRGSTFIFTLPA